MTGEEIKLHLRHALRDYCVSSGKTQKQLAEILHTDQPIVSALLTTDRTFKIENLVDMLAHAGIEVEIRVTG